MDQSELALAETRTHSRPPRVAEVALRVLEITDLVSAVDSPSSRNSWRNGSTRHRDTELPAEDAEGFGK